MITEGPSPEIKPIYSQTYLDTTTKIQWANNNMHAIWTKRQQAKEDLEPIYDNIDKNISKSGRSRQSIVIP